MGLAFAITAFALAGLFGLVAALGTEAILPGQMEAETPEEQGPVRYFIATMDEAFLQSIEALGRSLEPDNDARTEDFDAWLDAPEGELRALGFFDTLEQAQEACRKEAPWIRMVSDGDFLVIEAIRPGVIGTREIRYWYRFDRASQAYLPCPTPEGSESLSHFAIG